MDETIRKTQARKIRHDYGDYSQLQESQQREEAVAGSSDVTEEAFQSENSGDQSLEESRSRAKSLPLSSGSPPVEPQKLTTSGLQSPELGGSPNSSSGLHSQRAPERGSSSASPPSPHSASGHQADQMEDVDGMDGIYGMDDDGSGGSSPVCTQKLNATRTPSPELGGSSPSSSLRVRSNGRSEARTSPIAHSSPSRSAPRDQAEGEDRMNGVNDDGPCDMNLEAPDPEPEVRPEARSAAQIQGQARNHALPTVLITEPVQVGLDEYSETYVQAWERLVSLESTERKVERLSVNYRNAWKGIAPSTRSTIEGNSFGAELAQSLFASFNGRTYGPHSSDDHQGANVNGGTGPPRPQDSSTTQGPPVRNVSSKRFRSGLPTPTSSNTVSAATSSTPRKRAKTSTKPAAQTFRIHEDNSVSSCPAAGPPKTNGSNKHSDGAASSPKSPNPQPKPQMTVRGTAITVHLSDLDLTRSADHTADRTAESSFIPNENFDPTAVVDETQPRETEHDRDEDPHAAPPSPANATVNHDSYKTLTDEQFLRVGNGGGGITGSQFANERMGGVEVATETSRVRTWAAVNR